MRSAPARSSRLGGKRRDNLEFPAAQARLELIPLNSQVFVACLFKIIHAAGMALPMRPLSLPASSTLVRITPQGRRHENAASNAFGEGGRGREFC